MTFNAKTRLSDDSLVIEIPNAYQNALRTHQDRVQRKHGGYSVISIGTPKRPRSTGLRSQNSKVWGMCTDIRDQFHQAGHLDITTDQIYEAMKRMAVPDGYPTRLNIVDGIEEPESQSRVSVEQDQILINVIQRFADENSMYLTEYIDGRPVKCIGGKPID